MTSSEMSVFQTHRIRIYDKLRSAYRCIIQDEINNHTHLEPKLNYVNGLSEYCFGLSEFQSRLFSRVIYLKEYANLTEDYVGATLFANI